MITELKKNWKLLKYTYQFKTNIITALIFVVLGIFWLLINGPEGLLLSTVYFYIGPLMLVQLTTNLLYSNMVTSSMQKKMLDRTFPNVMGWCSSLLSFVVPTIYMTVYSIKHPTEELSGGNMLVVVGLVLVVTIIYYSVAFKYFVVSTILFAVCFALAFSCGMAFLVRSGVEISMLSGSLIGFVLIIVANIVAALIRKALYKLPNSPLAGGMALRKAMQ